MSTYLAVYGDLGLGVRVAGVVVGAVEDLELQLLVRVGGGGCAHHVACGAVGMHSVSRGVAQCFVVRFRGRWVCLCCLVAFRCRVGPLWSA